MATMILNLKPFTVPSYVPAEMPPATKEEGFKELPSFHLTDIPPDQLAVLCNEFRAAVFEKAGKIDPGRGNRDLIEALDRLLLAVENDQLLPASSSPVNDARAALANHL